jgi:hypothetical protein
MNLVDVCRRDVAELQTRARAISPEGDERAHLFNRETEVPTAANERELLHILLAVQAVTALLPRRPRQQGDRLVIPDRRDVGPRTFHEARMRCVCS